MTIEILKDDTVIKKTGRLRFRNDRKGRAILQVEYKSFDIINGDNILLWRDASISDIQWREK